MSIRLKNLKELFKNSILITDIDSLVDYQNKDNTSIANILDALCLEIIKLKLQVKLLEDKLK